jgi:hypothetical protein
LFCLKNKELVQNDPKYRWANKILSDNAYSLHEKVLANRKTVEFIVKSSSSVGARRRYLCYAELMEQVISMAHKLCGHMAHRSTHNLICMLFTHVTRPIVKEFVRTCQFCVDRAVMPKVVNKPLQNITAKVMFERVVIDLIDYSRSPGGSRSEYKYLFHMIDHQSSFHFTDALKTKTAEEVYYALRRAFAVINYPTIVHSDNGSEFTNALIKNYLADNKIRFVHGKPYTPSTQGKVERNNRTIQQIIEAYLYERKDTNATLTWFDVYTEATIAINANYSSTTKSSPYLFVFSQFPINYNAFEELFYNSNELNCDSLSSSQIDPEIRRITIDDDGSNDSLGDKTHSISDSNRRHQPSPVFNDVFPQDSLNSHPSLSQNDSYFESKFDPPNIEGKEGDDVIEENDDESANIAAEDEITRQQKIVIRQQAIENYFGNSARMKATTDRLRAAKQVVFSIGTIIGIRIPVEIKQKKINKLPAVIFEKKEVNGATLYKLGSMGSIISGWTDGYELVELDYSTYANILNATDTPSQNPIMLKRWVKYINGKPKPELSLTAVYKKYLEKHYNSPPKPSIPSISTQAPVLSVKRKRTFDVNEIVAPSKKPREDQCAACLETLHIDSFHRCHSCHHRMHNNIICSMKQQITMVECDDGPPNLFCSFECAGIPYPSIGLNILQSSQDVDGVRNTQEPLTKQAKEPPVPEYKVGAIVCLKIPPESLLQNAGILNPITEIPVVILEYDYDYEDCMFIYSVAIKGYTIDGWFRSDLFINSAENWSKKLIFGIDAKVTQSTVNKWGYIKKSEEYKYVTLLDAYRMFVEHRNYNGEFAKVIYRKLE